MTIASLERPDHVARKITGDRVAPRAAAGFARRRGGRWEISSGEETPRSEGSIFDLASLTKPMTAFAIVRAGIDRRALLGDLLNEVRGTAADVPLEIVLAHRAGLEANLPLFEPLVVGGVKNVDRGEAIRRAASARRDDARGVLPEEGFAPVYSDLGYILAGEVLARATGARDAGEAIERLVVAPLGLSAELGTARALSEIAAAFDRRVIPTEVVAWRGGEVRGCVHDENAWALTGTGGSGHAGMFGTVDAVLRFGAAALDAIVRGDGPLAGGGDLSWLVRERPYGSLRAGFDGKSDGSDGSRSSAGKHAGPRTFGHLGFTGTSLWIDPEQGSVVSLLTNRVHPTRENVAIRQARPVAHDALWKMAQAR